MLTKQPMNRRVVWALQPCVGGAVYFFGWRSLAVVAWSLAVAYFCEYLFTRRRGEAVSDAVLVTGIIFALVMPPTVPWHVAGIGAGFAVVFGKEVFGGYRCNIFNPAMAGRCFLYVCFPVAMTATWAPPAQGPWGALGRWTTAESVDSITGATPMAHLKAGRLELVRGKGVTEIPPDIPQGQVVRVDQRAFLKALLFGRVGGTMGVTSVALILIGGVYLFYTKTASRTIILWMVLTYGVLNQALNALGVKPAPMGLTAMMGGGFLFGAFFMATDPISAPKTQPARAMYGVLIAVCTTVIRNFSMFNGGLMFSILIGNMFAPILDYYVRGHGHDR